MDEADTTAFQFNGSLGAFSLHNGESTVFSELEPGSYTVSEALGGTWELVEVECTASGSRSAWRGSVPVNLVEGEVAACTFTNEEQEQTLGPTGSLTIEKEATPADGTAFSFDGGVLGEFALRDPSDPSVTFTELEAGAYTVTELPPRAGGRLETHRGRVHRRSEWSASGPSVVVNLAEGEAAVCTFRNASGLPLYRGAALVGADPAHRPGRHAAGSGGDDRDPEERDLVGECRGVAALSPWQRERAGGEGFRNPTGEAIGRLPARRAGMSVGVEVERPER